MRHIDLHSHTRYSDGTSTVENTLRSANELHLSILSVTDHNNVNAYGEIMQKRDLFGGAILPGVELGTVFDGELIEILGYGIDLATMEALIRERYLTFHDKQVKGAALDVNAVIASGAVLDDDFIRAMRETPDQIFDPNHETNRPYLLKELQLHPENQRFFANREEFESIDAQTFSRKYLFNAKSALYSDQSSLFPSPKEVVHMIHQSGGIAFLAHPWIYAKDFTDRLEGILPMLGVDGVECVYGTFTEEQQHILSQLCDKLGLFKSGGSDFHGLDMRPQNLMGLANGIPIDENLILPWLDTMRDRLI